MKRISDDEFERSIREGDPSSIATVVGFHEPLVPVGPSVRHMWGWAEPHPEWSVWATGRRTARVLIVEGEAASAGEIARRALRKSVATATLVITIARRDVTFAFATHEERGPRARTMTIDRARPDAVGLAQLRALGLDALAAPDLDDPYDAIARHFVDALDQDELARSFFAGFRQTLDVLREGIVDGPTDERSRHDIALTTLLRLVFLYLLQRKGALDCDPWFVIRRVREARSRGDDIYQSCLRPLFFGLLNTPTHLRSAAAAALGEVPFLNGGLFEPLPVENAHPDLTWSSDAWNAVFEGLLERYHFTTREAAEESARAVDPEMLGKVFEGLMFGDERASSGSFYTPREVVAEIVEDALVTWAVEHADVDRARVFALVRGREVALAVAEKDRLFRAFSSVRVLDPAVGTGAFLLEALRKLCSIRASLTGRRVDYLQMREVIHHSLYGVDLQPTASRLCALRLWLAMMSTLPEGMPIDAIPPLPNLDHRVATGNALLDTSDLASRAIDGRRFIVESPRTAELRDQISALQSRFLVCHGHDKIVARKALEAAERDLQRAFLEARLSRLVQLATPLRDLAAGVDLFGDPITLDRDQAAALEALDRELGATRTRMKALERGGAGAISFGFATRFSEALGEGGFDIIVTNPPWVRTQRIDPDQRSLLRARYASADNTLWPQSRALGIRAPFGTQVDLAALFIERSLELLQPGGRLAALVPAKLLRSLHGGAIRRIMAQHDVERIEDHSDARQAMFDATTYPALFIIRKTERPRRRRRSAPREVRVGVWRQDRVDRWVAPAARLGGAHPSAPWVLVEPEIEAIFETMWKHSKALGLDGTLVPSRGIFTGCNDVFLRPRGEFEELLGSEAAELVRPVLAGRDLDEDGWATSAEILWLYDEHLKLAAHAPEAVEKYFRDHESRLRDRSDHVSVLPLWQVFRVKPELLEPKVVWPDIAPMLRAEVVPGGVVPLNTTYVIPCDDDDHAARVAALLNSEPVRAFAWALAERARGGFRRHFAWVIRMLPLPTGFHDWRPVGVPSQWPAEIAALFGLDEVQCRTLEAWRLGEDWHCQPGEVA